VNAAFNADPQFGVPWAASRKAAETADSTIMKRRLAIRDRMMWLVALVALGVVAYILLPLWLVVAAVVVLLGVPVLLRQARHSRWRH